MDGQFGAERLRNPTERRTRTKKKKKRKEKGTLYNRCYDPDSPKCSALTQPRRSATIVQCEHLTLEEDDSNVDINETKRIKGKQAKEPAPRFPSSGFVAHG